MKNLLWFHRVKNKIAYREVLVQIQIIEDTCLWHLVCIHQQPYEEMTRQNQQTDLKLDGTCKFFGKMAYQKRPWLVWSKYIPHIFGNIIDLFGNMIDLKRQVTWYTQYVRFIIEHYINVTCKHFFIAFLIVLGILCW